MIGNPLGHSLAAYDESDIAIIKEGTEFNDNSFFIGPGTGLGAALLIGNDNVIPTEIGNTTGLTKALLKNYAIDNDDHFRTLEDVYQERQFQIFMNIRQALD